MSKRQTTIREELEAGRMVTTFTSGDSMEPLLSDHSTWVEIQPKKRGFSVGELPIYQRPDGTYVIHRIVKIGEDSCITRGDNRIQGECVPKEWLLGTVTKIYRKGKQIRTAGPGYRLYVWCWRTTYPFRLFRHSLGRFLRRLVFR